MGFWEGFIIGIVVGVLIPFGVPSLIKWTKKVKDGEEPSF